MSDRSTKRAETVAKIRALKAEGLTRAEIAARMGLTVSSIGNYLNDPTGEKSRARKEKYREPCPTPGCGNMMSYGGARGKPMQCGECTRKKQSAEQRIWTPEKMVESFQEFVRVNRRPPTVTDVMGLAPSMRKGLSRARIREIKANPVKLPHPSLVSKTFGSWADGLRAAGLGQAQTGGAGARLSRINRA